MTVKELIQELSKFDSDTEVLITAIDPTDYTYINDVNGVKESFLNEGYHGDSFLMEELDESDKEDIEEGELVVQKVVVLDGGNV